MYNFTDLIKKITHYIGFNEYNGLFVMLIPERCVRNAVIVRFLRSCQDKSSLTILSNISEVVIVLILIIV